MVNNSILKDKISEGYAYHKVVLENGEVVDYIFLDINDKFTEFTGLGKEVLNKKVTEVLPGIEDSNFDWIGTYGEIAQNGGEKTFSAYSESLGKWYQVKVYSDKQGYFVTLFQEIIDYEKDDLANELLENQAMFDASQTAMFLVKVHDRKAFTYIKNNQIHQEATGLPTEYINGKTPVEVVGREQGDEIIENYEKCVETVSQLSYEETLVLPGGTKTWKTTLTPLTDQNGNVTHIVGSSQDVTDYKKANEKLESNKNFLNRLIEDSPLGIFQVNAKGEYVDVNSMGCKILGCSKEEIVNMTVFDALDDSYLDEGEKFFAELKEKGYAKSELLMKRKNGDEIWVDLLTSKVEENRYIGYHKDITDEVKAIEKLRESESKNRSMVKAAKTVSLIITDLNSIVEEFSPGAENTFGYTREEMIGKHVGPLHTASEVEKLPDYIERLKKEKDGFTIEAELVRKSGESFPAYFTLQPLFDNSGEFSGTLGVAVDISELKDKKNQLSELVKEQELLLDNIEAQVWYLKDTEIYGKVNKAHADFFGVSKSALEHNTLWEIMTTKEEAEICIEGNKRVFEEKSKIYTEELVKNGEGEERLLAISKVPKLDKNGEVEFVVCYADDVTEKKKREREFINLVENSPDMVVRHDTYSRHIYANTAVEKELGMSKDFLLGKTYKEIYQELKGEIDVNDPLYQQFDKMTKLIREVSQTTKEKEVYNELFGKHLHGRIVPEIDEKGEVNSVLVVTRDITEQKQAEKELQQTKVLLEGLFESIQDGISVLNSDLTIRYTNSTIKTWHESDLPLEGKKCYEVYHKRDIPCDPCPSIRCLETGNVEVEEIQVQTDIDLKWIEIFSYPLFEEGAEEPTGIVEFVRDITEKKEWEKQLIETQRLLEGALNAVPDVIGIQYPDHTIERYNQAGYEMLNMTPEEVKGNKCYELIGRTSECDQCATSEALKTKKLETVEKYFPELDIYLNARANPVLNEEGEIKYIVEQLQDVTNYNKTLNALRESEEKFRSYVENANDIIFTVNDKAVFTYISPNWENITGYDLQESVGKSVYEFIYSEDIDNVASAAKELLQRGYFEGEVEYRVINKDGSLNWHSSKLSILEKRESEIIVLGIGRDITERKQAEEKIEYLSFHDSLTGLYNRAYVEEEMQRLDTKRQLPISLIMADLNGLKLVNDTYGHYVGDKMLTKSAEILKQSTRKEDIVARWGGDEFVILLPQTSEEEADNICKRINDACKDAYIKEVPISIAAGFSTKNDLNESLEKVIKKAEDEMYNTKLADSQSAKTAILDTLLRALETKGIETEKHIELMEEAALKIGKKIGLLESDLKRLSLVVKLHDIGKINVPEEILTKSEPLTPEEWETLKEHPQIGYKIARSTEEFAHVAEEILAHHERWDGKGYPQGLKGKEIPLLARITAVAGAYEKIINKEYGSENVSYDVIKREFDKRAGSSLDPELVNVFIKTLKNES